MISSGRSTSCILAAAVLAGTLGSMVCAGEKSLALVIPNRHTVIQLATDIAEMKPVAVISYSDVGGPSAPLLHVWRAADRSWVRVPAESLRSGAIFRVPPSEVIVVGTDDAMRSSLASAVCAGVPVKEVNTLDSVVLVNTIDERVPFRRSQWRFLQDKYSLEVKDLNAERRRYGRYGPPGSAPRRPSPDPLVIEPEEDVRFDEAPQAPEPTVDAAEVPVLLEEKGVNPAATAIPATPVAAPVVSDMTPEEMGLAGDVDSPANK